MGKKKPFQTVASTPGRPCSEVVGISGTLGARVGAIVRGEGDAGQVLVPHHDTVIEEGDHVIIFVPHKRLLPQVEKLFQVRATFF